MQFPWHLVPEICVPGGRCFKIYVETTNFDAAYDSCKSRGETFATIDSLEEQNAIFNAGICPTSNGVWFNMRQYGGVGSTWQYKDNDGNLHSYPSFTNWDTSNSQPQANDEYCAALLYGYGGRWHDISCSYTLECYVCHDREYSCHHYPQWSLINDSESQ